MALKSSNLLNIFFLTALMLLPTFSSISLELQSGENWKYFPESETSSQNGSVIMSVGNLSSLQEISNIFPPHKFRHEQKRHANFSSRKISTESASLDVSGDAVTTPLSISSTKNNIPPALFSSTESQPSATLSEMNSWVPIGESETLKNFDQEYWIRVAQAKAMTIAVENGILPELDHYSLLIKPADCGNDAKCYNFVSKCAEQQANLLIKETQKNQTNSKTPIKNISFYIKQILSKCGLKTLAKHNKLDLKLPETNVSIPFPFPVFHCNNYLNETNAITNFRLDYPSLSSSLINISSDIIPRYFVLEFGQTNKSGNGHISWKLTTIPVQPFWFYSFNTKPGNSYTLRVTAISPKYMYPPVTSGLISIYKSSSIINVNPPRDFHVESVSMKGKTTSKPSALLRWESGSGENASCNYDVFFMDENDVQKIERKFGHDAFWVKLDDLNFQQSYDVQIMEKVKSGGEAELGTEFYIPSCLEFRGFSFELCPPPPPTNIRLENPTDQSFWISWNPPKYANESNTIENYIMTIDWIYTPPKPVTTSSSSDGFILGAFPSASLGLAASPHNYRQVFTPKYKNHKIFGGVIMGNLNRFHIKDLLMFRGKFKISIVAVSKAGSSQAAFEFVQFQGSPLDSNWTTANILIILFSVLGILTVISTLCILKHAYEKHLRRQRRREIFENYEKNCLQRKHNAWKDAPKWEIHSCNLTLGDAIGQGNFGIVRKATLYQNDIKSVVAVKTLQVSNGPLQGKIATRSLEEFEILKNLDPHVHVVGLKGIVTKHVPQPLLVVEYCDGGDLQSHLRNVLKTPGFKKTHFIEMTDSILYYGKGIDQIHHAKPNNYFTRKPRKTMDQIPFPITTLYQQSPETELTIVDLLSYARQVASGMDYLSSNKIVHRDLAARNILISGVGESKTQILKISDFGLSRDIYERNWYKMSSTGKIPIKWMAIECILKDIYTTKSDVWSFGILLWEIFTYGGNPYPGIDNIKIFELISNGYRMPKPDSCPADVYELMRLCWDDNPAIRPDFSTIRLILEEMIENFTQTSYFHMDRNTNVITEKSVNIGDEFSEDDGFQDGMEVYGGISSCFGSVDNLYSKMSQNKSFTFKKNKSTPT